jgi:hypothetical protein
MPDAKRDCGVLPDPVDARGIATDAWAGRSFTRRTTRLPLVIGLAGAMVASALASLPSLAGNAAPAAVKGKVVGWEKLVPPQYTDATKIDAHRYTWREPSPTVKSDFRKLSANVSRDVCVAAFISGTAQPHDGKIIMVTGGRATPSTIVVAPGSRLVFKNADPFPHTLYEVGNASWAANPTAPGSSRDWSGTSQGVHEIRDQLFPSVAMHIVVEPSAAEFAFPDHEGAFSMALPPGEYSFKVYFDGKLVSKPIEGIKLGEKGVEIKEPIAVGGDSK